MRLHLLVPLAFSLSLLAFGQPPSPPKLGADAPTMGYREAPEWPTQILNAAGTPGGPWNFIQVAGVAVDAVGHILVLHRVPGKLVTRAALEEAKAEYRTQASLAKHGL